MRVRVRMLVALAFLAAVSLVACTGDSRVPTQASSAPSFATAGDPQLAADIRALIDQLFLDFPRRQQAHQHFTQVEAAWARGDLAGAYGKVAILEQHTLDQLLAGRIADPNGAAPPTPTEAVIDFIAKLHAYTGQEAETIGPNTFAGIVYPSDRDTTVHSGLQLSVFIPAGSIPQAAILYVERDTTDANIAPGAVDVSDLYEVHFIPEIAFTEIYVGICTYPAPPAGARIAHEIDPGVIEVYPNVVIPTIVCDAEPHDPPGGLASRGMFGRLASLASSALSVFAPNVAFAGHSATGAKLIELSPLQVVNVETEIVTSAASVTYGADVTISAKLKEAGGDDVLPGRTLTLSVNGAGYPDATTDANGDASWTIADPAAGSYSYTVGFAAETTTTGDTLHEAATATGSFSVAQAALTVTASSFSGQVGDAVPACTVSYSGLVNGDTPASIGSVSTCTYPATVGLNQVVNPTVIVPAPANYAVTYVPGSFTLLYASASGTFLSPLPMREIRQGSKIPVKFQLLAPNGSPIANRTLYARVKQGGVWVTPQYGPLLYKSGVYEIGLVTSGWPLGVIELHILLDDGTTRFVPEIIK